MPSPDVVAPALVLLVPLLSLPLSIYNCLCRRSPLAKPALPALVATFAALAGGSALRREQLAVLAKVFTTLLHTTLSAISIYALSPSSQPPAFPPPFLGFFLSLAALLIACELVSAIIPTSPPLLPAALALVSRGILLALAISTAFLLHRRHAAFATSPDGEKGSPGDQSCRITPRRVSSPTHATWPFPRSLAPQDNKFGHRSSTANKSAPHDQGHASRTPNINEDACAADGGNLILLPLVLTSAQVFATLSAGLDVAASMTADIATSRPNQRLPHILLASAACTLLWSLAVLAIVQVLPSKPQPYSSEKRLSIRCEQRTLGDGSLSRDNPVPRTPKPSLSRRESDSLLDFLSLRDPFASSPPPPPPLPPVGLGLDEVDVGWNGSKEIGVQYRFPAPRSVIKGGRRKEKTARSNGKKRLVHQDSARTLLPVPETRGTDADAEKDKGFGDEARLAQLLLQSLSECGEDCDSLGASTPVPTVPPQVAHIQQTSRWSTGTTEQSVVSASASNRSGVSTYTTCASEKVPTSRISMNTIASALGSRKSSETKRKSAMTASSAKC